MPNMANRMFIFNVVVTDIELNTLNEKDPKKLLVDVNFNNVVIPITASRINLHDLKPEYEIGLKLDTTQIRHSLRCGLSISVKYNFKLLGIGYIHFDENVAADVCEGMDKLVLDKCCLFEGHGRVIGTLGVKCSLRLKLNDTAQEIGSECRHPKDIFYMANQFMRQELCNRNNNISADPVEDSELLKFGVQRFAREDIWTTPLKPCFYYNPIGNAISCELKKMAVEGDKVAESITISSGQQKPSEELPLMPRNLRRVGGENDETFDRLFAKALSETKRARGESNRDMNGNHCKCARKCFHKRDQIDSQQSRHTLRCVVHPCKKAVQLNRSILIYSSVLSEQKSSVKNDSIEIKSSKSESRSIPPDHSCVGSNRIQNDSAQCSGTSSSIRTQKHSSQHDVPIVKFLKFMLNSCPAEYQPDHFRTLRSRRYGDDKMKLIQAGQGVGWSRDK